MDLPEGAAEMPFARIHLVAIVANVNSDTQEMPSSNV